MTMTMKIMMTFPIRNLTLSMIQSIFLGKTKGITMEISIVIQRDAGSWVSNPITRQEYYLTREAAVADASTWPGYGIGKDIEITSITVKE